MFHSLATLLQIPMVTSDGEKKAVRSFLFDDQSWSIRYLVVDAGKWFAPRQVVVPTNLVDVPDWNGKVIQAHITSEEFLKSPDTGSVRPVSRQQQLAWNRHFGWPDDNPYWCGPASPDPSRREFSTSTPDDDPHLRQTEDLLNYQIWGTNGYVGLLQGFFLEDASWHIPYLLVRAGDWIYTEKIVSTRNIAAISWGLHRMVLDCPSHAIQEQAALQQT